MKHPGRMEGRDGDLAVRAVGKDFMAQGTFKQHLEGRVQPMT